MVGCDSMSPFLFVYFRYLMPFLCHDGLIAFYLLEPLFFAAFLSFSFRFSVFFVFLCFKTTCVRRLSPFFPFTVFPGPFTILYDDGI